jgi:LacI family transcriptional regulator
MSQAAAVINQNLIAERLNVSIATVSRALRNRPGIHPRTRSRVMEVAAELGYRPLRTHQSKKASAAKYIGVFIRSLHRGVRPLYLDGMAEMAAHLNVSLVLHHTPLEDADSLIDASRQPPALRDGTLNGVVLIHRWPANVVNYLFERMACVSIVHQIAGIPMDTVDMDHAHGMTILAHHLHKLGHRRIGFFGLNPDIAWSKARYGGYVQALCELRIPMDPSLIVAAPARALEDRNVPWEEEIDRAAEMVREQEVTALMSASQWSASVLCRGLIKRGLRIPEDVSVTGFDDLDPLGIEGMKLTSTRIAGEAMGAEALRRVLLRIAEPSRPAQTIHFACTLMEGQSTAAIPAEAFDASKAARGRKRPIDPP